MPSVSMLSVSKRIAFAALPAAVGAALVVGAVRAHPTMADAAAFDVAEAGPATMPAGVAPRADAGSAQMMAGQMTANPAARLAARRMHLADRLATLHVYLDITPQQEGSWHAFSQAVLNMVPDARDLPQPGQPESAFDGIDRMAKMIQQRAQAAQAMDQAAQTLKASLTPEQITRADGAWALMRAHMMRMHRMHEHAWMRWSHPGGQGPQRG